nr:DNA helicase [Tanacetum cinerariifolium]
MKTKRKLVPKDVLTGAIGKTGVVDTRGSWLGHVGESGTISSEGFRSVANTVGGIPVYANRKRSRDSVPVCDNANGNDCGSLPNAHIEVSGIPLYGNQKRSRDTTLTCHNATESDCSSSKRQYVGADFDNRCLVAPSIDSILAGGSLPNAGNSFGVHMLSEINRVHESAASLDSSRKRTRGAVSRPSTSYVGGGSSSTRRLSSSGCRNLNTPNATSTFHSSGVRSTNTGVDENCTGPPLEYKYIGKCEHSCEHCGARFWYDERIKDTRRRARPAYHRCCMAGRVVLRTYQIYPEHIQRLLRDRHFMENIRAYNQMFSMTSLGARVDDSINIEVPPFKVKLFSVVGAHEYELPTGDMLGAIVYEPGPDTDMDFDIVIEQRTGQPQRVSKLHPSYMALQFPFLFVYGEDGYSKDMKMQRNRIDYIREHQNDIRNEYLSGIYDAIRCGDSDGSDSGGRLILPQSFTGTPHYMYAHYIDALAICRVHGNPSYFITFTCNVKWPEITEYMDDFPGVTTTDRADIVDHSRIRNQEDIDKYISAGLPSKETDPEGHRVVAEFMIHGPCGEICPTAACMKNGPNCTKHFPKEYCESTYIDAAGFVHYRRKDTRSTTTKQNVELDNGYVTEIVIDEIKNYLNSRYIGPHEACWSLFEFDIHSRERAVQVLAVHKENMQRVVFRERDQLQDIPYVASISLGIPNLHIHSSDLENYTKYEFEACLNHCLRSLADFGISLPPEDLMSVLRNRLLMEEKSYNRELLAIERDKLVGKLNDCQRNIFDLIIHAVTTRTQELIFLYGQGGTGKTFLWKTIIYTLRAQGKIVLAVASSGIASLLLPSGRTALSRFKLPLELSDSSVCSVTKNTQLATLLKETDLIIWDESPMNDRRCFETLDRTLRDILDTPHKLFGGKPVMLGGDFRQTRPVKKSASRTEIISSSITESYLWRSFKLFVLTEYTRLTQGNLSDVEKKEVSTFANWLLNVADGVLDLQDKAIVCPKHDTADMINAKVMNMLPGHTTTYISNDEAMQHGHDGGEVELLYPTEYLNTLNFAGIPPHELNLKIGNPIMLLRNINIVGGLCNGTRMIVRQLLPKVIEAEIITGTRISQKAYIPRIPLTMNDAKMPFIFKRKQFPVGIYLASSLQTIFTRIMELANVDDTSEDDKGKMILMEPQITNISELSTTDYNKTIEAIVYRIWTSKTTKTRTPTKFCCILIDKQGTPIQANMGLRDAEYFDQLLQLQKAFYRFQL